MAAGANCQNKGRLTCSIRSHFRLLPPRPARVASIKAVLPALTGRTYANLAIQEGDTAQTTTWPENPRPSMNTWRPWARNNALRLKNYENQFAQPPPTPRNASVTDCPPFGSTRNRWSPSVPPSMPTRDRVSGPPQILRQIALHLRRRLERHRVQMAVQFREKPDAIPLYHRRRFVASFMVGQSFLRCQPRHPHVNAGFRGIAVGILGSDFAQPGHARIKQNHVNMMMLSAPIGPQPPEIPPLHHDWSPHVLVQWDISPFQSLHGSSSIPPELPYRISLVMKGW
jgi:hypothetical protein